MKRGIFKLLVSSAALLGAGGALCSSAQADEGWTYSVTPYLWLTNMDGKFAVRSSLPTVEVKQDFGDIVDTAQFLFAGKFEAANGPWHLLGELTYADIGNAEAVSGALLTAASVGSETVFFNTGVGYRVVDDPQMKIDIIGGAKVTWTKTDISLNFTNGSVAGAGRDENWIDAFIGARGEWALGGSWSVTAYGDVGGGASDYNWQTYAAANYHFNSNTTLFAGYRASKDDYDDDGYIYDVEQFGPILGATFVF